MIILEVNNTILEFFRKKSSNSFIFYVYPRCDLSIMLIMAKTEQDSGNRANVVKILISVTLYHPEV